MHYRARWSCRDRKAASPSMDRYRSPAVSQWSLHSRLHTPPHLNAFGRVGGERRTERDNRPPRPGESATATATATAADDDTARPGHNERQAKHKHVVQQEAGAAAFDSSASLSPPRFVSFPRTNSNRGNRGWGANTPSVSACVCVHPRQRQSKHMDRALGHDPSFLPFKWSRCMLPFHRGGNCSAPSS